MAVNETWLAQTAEQAIEPLQPIVDSHHHLWDHPPQRPDESYTAVDYLRDAAVGHKIIASVYVECNSKYRQAGPEILRPVGETEYVHSEAIRHRAPGSPELASAIVGYADLLLGDSVAAVLDEHVRVTPERFRGIRQTTAWDAAPELNYKHLNIIPEQHMDPHFRRGIGELVRRNLSFDAWAFHTQLHELIDLARSFPELKLIVNHLAGPLWVGPYANRRAEIFQQWQHGVRGLAACPNVFLKLGGMTMHCIGLNFKAREVPPSSDDLVLATQDYYRIAIDTFGPERCMFESNFPVDKESVPASVLWNCFKKIAAPYSADERNWLFARTAAKVYRIEPVVEPYL